MSRDLQGPHKSQTHQVELRYHPEEDVWTTGEGIPVYFQGYGHTSKRRGKDGEVLWATELVDGEILPESFTSPQWKVFLRALTIGVNKLVGAKVIRLTQDVVMPSQNPS